MTEREPETETTIAERYGQTIRALMRPGAAWVVAGICGAVLSWMHAAGQQYDDWSAIMCALLMASVLVALADAVCIIMLRIDAARLAVALLDVHDQFSVERRRQRQDTLPGQHLDS